MESLFLVIVNSVNLTIILLFSKWKLSRFCCYIGFYMM